MNVVFLSNSIFRSPRIVKPFLGTKRHQFCVNNNKCVFDNRPLPSYDLSLRRHLIKCIYNYFLNNLVNLINT